MGRKLRATVHVGGMTYYAGDEPSADTAALITNPDAWGEEAKPTKVETTAAPEREDPPTAREPETGDNRPRGNRRTKS
jgi:hypothetical protein